MNIAMESAFDGQEPGRSKEAIGWSQQTDFNRECGRIGENGVKAELSSPGPATPMQVAPLPQQKPRDASASCPESVTTRSAHCLEAAETGCEVQFGSETAKSVPASTQDAAKSETESGGLLTGSNECCVGGSRTAGTTARALSAAKHGVGHRSVSSEVGRMGGPTKAVSKDGGEVRVASKGSEEEASMSSCGAMERACSDGSMKSMGRPCPSVKVESSGFALDGGLSLGLNGVQVPGSSEGAGVDFSRVWENVGGSGGRRGDCYVASSGDEGAVVLQLSQGRGPGGGGEEGERGMGGEWKGEHLQLSIGLQSEERVGGGRADGDAEHGLREVEDEDAGVRVEHGAKDGTDSSNDRSMKRVKREVVETRMSVDGCGERMWERNEDQDGRSSGTYENKVEDFRNLFWGNGAAALLPQGYREKSFGKAVEVGSGEPKTVVVKKTPKRVHNSDPSTMFTRSELLMFEEGMRSPGPLPRAMLSPPRKQGTNGAMVASDANSASQHLYRKSRNLMCGLERGVVHSKAVRDGCSVLQSQLESRMDRGSSCSLMSSSKHHTLMSESSLPFSLSFSPKPQRAVVPSSRTSTEEEWGKSLALCGPGAESAGEVGRSGEEAKASGYQERFVQLQVFLKKCDEDEQSYLVDALRSLSAAGRSSHAVGLEQRALWLSMEEGKEMARLRSLNVMGQRSSMKGHSDVGCTPQGPRVPSFGNGAEHAQQQSSANMRSPQMQMLMSGSMPGSAYKESYRSG